MYGYILPSEGTSNKLAYVFLKTCLYSGSIVHLIGVCHMVWCLVTSEFLLSDQFYVLGCFGVVLGDPAEGVSVADMFH